ncbi:MAG: hypothetical protein HQ543_02210, partial [Bacteroidetes bacterium]|nr:hypothetical protein [Bacteroidota bacterium]
PFKLLNGKLKLKKNERNVVANVEDIKSLTQTLSDPFITTYFTRSIVVDEEELKNKLQHTALIEIDEMPNFSAFPVKAVKIGSITHYRYFNILINGVTYDCYCHENKDLNTTYLFIESMAEVVIEEFKECADVILHCIAVFNGDWYRDDLFIYSRKIDEEEWKGYKSFQFHFVGKSIIAKYKICDSLRCSQYLEHIGQNKNSKKLCAGMDFEIFSTIAAKIYKNSKIKKIIELLIEGSSAKNLVLRASVYSVAIETLTNIVYNENEQALKPIDDEDLAQKVSQKLLEVIDEYSTFMTDEAINILTKKINNINKPVNVDRLTKSFSILGIKLNDHDENTLRTRNKFLHGSTPFKNFEIDKEKENEFILLTTKLRLLICMLLLKYLGYKGHIYNFYGHSKSIEAKSLIEHFVRFI